MIGLKVRECAEERERYIRGRGGPNPEEGLELDFEYDTYGFRI